MQTLLSRFCEEFVQVLRPLVTPLGRAAEAMSAAPDDLPAKSIQADLIDLRHQMELLADKVADQQAYVLIFGPLKSGKSTLMNALAASYVSEVSSLPAYPCMVFVSHASRREYTVTNYKGNATVFTEADALHEHVGRAHARLAERLREAETNSREFDPHVHFTDAIRRIDVRVPAGDLEESGAVLVDTPGLYSRMKFGYDRMTRDFRNAAACAIFVVRSDNLFLEQVFAEFSQLLELFSRIFLVVNIDSTKMDLDAEGNLVPSLEQRDPSRIVDAFREFAMSAPLKAAADEGRLGIYPMDLLRSASERVRGARRKDKGRNEDERAKDERKDKKKKDKKSDAPGADAGPADFEDFVRDLTEYLNSTDYLIAFLGDSLRRGGSLLEEAEGMCANEEVAALRRRRDELAEQITMNERLAAAAEQLDRFDWRAAFDEFKLSLEPDLERIAKDAATSTNRAIDGAIDAWFQSDDSLYTLIKNGLTPLLTRHQEELTANASRELSERVLQGHAGLALDADVTGELSAIGVDLGAIGRGNHQRADRNALIAVPPTPLRSEHVTVRRTLWDWILFRGPAALRRRLFGEPEFPASRIPKRVKAARLGDPAKREIRRRLADFTREFFEEVLDRVRFDFIGTFARSTAEELGRAIRDRHAEIDARLVRQRAAEAMCRSVLDPLVEVRGAIHSARQTIGELSSRYGRVDRDLLTQPLEPGYRLPANEPVRPASEPAPPTQSSTPRGPSAR